MGGALCGLYSVQQYSTAAEGSPCSMQMAGGMHAWASASTSASLALASACMPFLPSFLSLCKECHEELGGAPALSMHA